MYAYCDKNGQVAMVSQGKIKHDKFDEFEFNETDSAYQNQKKNGGQLYVRNGKMEYEPLPAPPIDVQKKLTDALNTSQNFNDFKNKMLNLLAQ